MSHFFERVYQVVRLVPPGQVVSYGQVAAMLGAPHAARTVGWALRALPADSDVPWHRVINAQGRISTSCRQHDASVQQQLLEAEGVVFDERGTVDLVRFQWEGLRPWEVSQFLERTGLAEGLAEGREHRDTNGRQVDAPPGIDFEEQTVYTVW